MAEETGPTGRYRLLMQSYMPRSPGLDSELLEPGTEVVWDGKPGPHMQPIDGGAQVAYVTAGADKMTLDPFARLPLTDAATDDDLLAERIARAMGPAMISALSKLGFMQQTLPQDPTLARAMTAGVVEMPMQQVAPPPEVLPPPPPAPPEVLPPPGVLPPPPAAPAPAPQAKRGK